MVNQNTADFYKQVKLALFVDSSLLSRIAKQQLFLIKQELGLADHQITVYSIDEHLDKAISWRIIACPTLVRLDIEPRRCLVGEFTNRELVLAFISIESNAS